MTDWTSARDEVLAAVKRLEQAYAASEDGPHYDAEATYAEELLSLAARKLVDATNALPSDSRPVGWTRVSCDGCDAVVTPTPANLDEPRMHFCADCAAHAAAILTDGPPF